MIFHSGVKLPEGTLLMFHRGFSPAGTHQVLLIFHGSLQTCGNSHLLWSIRCRHIDVQYIKHMRLNKTLHKVSVNVYT